MGWLLLLPLLLGGCFGCSSHSLRYLCTGVSGPSQGLPPFIAGGYVDHQPIVKYDSETEKSVPQVSWMLKAEKDNAQYWEKSTQEFLKLDMKFSQYLLDLQDQYNQSKGFHTLQLMYGCELSPDGRKEGYYRYGYDGRDFLSFEKETLTWTAADREAQVMKRKWEAELAKKQYRKAYLEEECIEWLQRYLDYGNETLLRTAKGGHSFATLGNVVGGVVAAAVVVVVVAAVIFFVRKKVRMKAAYERTSTSSQEPASSTSSSVGDIQGSTEIEMRNFQRGGRPPSGHFPL
uniref:major histocompatibility complex class I-related gene protein-like isoform X4 n=1 Tax=Podarcis muralis TaxID=64176 RepID=UPI0010A07091|nr:major histocompatibility complex class I-related gene protein-like isoform X4 [Podarcis muralis]